jgi:adenylate kinase family enzyme
MLSRLSSRGGRYDDGYATIKGRIDTFNRDTAVVLKHFATRGILRSVGANQTVDGVEGEMQRLFKDFTTSQD